MFKQFLEDNKQSFIKDLADLVAFQSISNVTGDVNCPYGKAVQDALNKSVDIAKRMGLDARNLNYLAEISMGDGNEKAYIACHADIVPVGNGWETDPFKLVLKDDGFLYGRGVFDNKGPAVAMIYALAAVKNKGLVPKVKLKLLIGGAEETGMDDLPHYMKKYGYPDYGLTPDAEFPIINTEAGMFRAKMSFNPNDLSDKIKLVSFKGGIAYNCVPDKAEAEIEFEPSVKKTLEAYLLNCENTSFVKGFEYKFDSSKLTLRGKGVNAHASVPHKGKNAVLDLAKIIYGLYNSIGMENTVIKVLAEYFAPDTNGKALGLYTHGEILGDITLNVGICDYEAGYFTIDMRLPQKGLIDKIKTKYSALADKYGFKLDINQADEYTHIDENTPFMQGLKNVYEKVMGEKAEFLGMKGLTYAKTFGGHGVAFGPVKSEEGEECGGLHGDNEHIKLSVLLRTAEVYAEVIKTLWC